MLVNADVGKSGSVFTRVCVRVHRGSQQEGASNLRSGEGESHRERGPRTWDGCDEEWARMRGRCVLLLEPLCHNIHGVVAVDAWHPR